MSAGICGDCLIANILLIASFISFAIGLLVGKRLRARLSKGSTDFHDYKKGYYIKLFGKRIDIW